METTDIKITKRDNYKALRELVMNYVDLQTLQDRLLEFIDHEVELIDQRSQKNKIYQKAHKATNDVMSGKIYDVLVNAPKAMSVADIVAHVEDSTPQKVIYRLGRLYKDGKITKTTETIKTENSTPRRITFYTAHME